MFEINKCIAPLTQLQLTHLTCKDNERYKLFNILVIIFQNMAMVCIKIDLFTSEAFIQTVAQIRYAVSFKKWAYL